ncbi:DUF4339 domain-containing protein [Luteimonas chenhongjianii]
MTRWYYLDGGNTRRGPITAAALRQLRQRGRLDDSTLPWRDGLPAWTPLRGLAQKLNWRRACVRGRRRTFKSRPAPETAGAALHPAGGGPATGGASVVPAAGARRRNPPLHSITDPETLRR